MQTEDIRRAFLHYFKKHHHAVIPSSPVVPHEDPTLLFNNAGMNQFKDVFLGRSSRDYKRAATSQKCIRAGGKHNDLENVGHTSRHLTFFEMLGNFSFGDYFKQDAIKFAWEVATEVFQFDEKRIWPTVFRDDDEAFELWKKYVPESRITRFGEKENFWSMGDVGPCGPCSELLYDRGEAFGKAKTPSEDPEGERFLEFWNLVFMQYNKTAEGVLEKLPKPSIDTGAGLERVVSLKMGVESVFETDVLRTLISRIEQISGTKYDLNDHVKSPAFRVIADHLRCLSFAIADGAQPSNTERGYVLRKILRRAVRYGRMLGMDDPFLAKVFPTLVDTMGADYPELPKSKTIICEVLTSEEEAFLRTLKRGGNILNTIIETAKSHGKQITGDDAFKLKDTYGLPLEEIQLIAKDSDLSIDIPRYQQLEKEAKERSRSTQKSVQQVAGENIFTNFVKEKGETQFLGYSQNSSDAHVVGIVLNGSFVNRLQEGEEGLIILDQSPFYAEMGGQIGDTGVLTTNGAKFHVKETKAPYKNVIAHLGKLEKGSLEVGEKVVAEIDTNRRQKIANNHTATHLLHWALHHVLGEHIKQAGSVVEPSRLRFDFNHHKALTPQEIRKLEDLVNEKIRENLPVQWYEIPYDAAQKRQDIKQFFGEKYSSQVRVIDIDFSKELCGGTHVKSLGQIGLFRINKESSIAAGVRRIEAVTGIEADEFSRQSEMTLSAIANVMKAQPHQLQERIEKLLDENKQLAADMKQFRKQQLAQMIEELICKAEMMHGIPVVIASLNLSPEDLKICSDELMVKLPSGIAVIGIALSDKCHIVARVSDSLVSKISANEIIKAVAAIIEGSGGGKPNSAQAGGKAPKNLPKALSAAKEFIIQQLEKIK